MIVFVRSFYFFIVPLFKCVFTLIIWLLFFAPFRIFTQYLYLICTSILSPMQVTLREKKIKQGKQKSLYLDFYPPIAIPGTNKSTRREFLGIYITVRSKSEEEKEANKTLKLKAQGIQADRIKQIGKGDFSFLHKGAAPTDSIYPLIDRIISKTECKVSKWKYTKLKENLTALAGRELVFKDITADFCNLYLDWVEEKYEKQNTRAMHCSTLSRFLNDAINADKIPEKIRKKIKFIQYNTKNTNRNFLLEHELKTLRDTPVKPSWKRCKDACLFSAASGLRRSDILALTWDNVMKDGEKYYIRFTQIKTDGREYQPLNNTAVSIMGNPGKGLVFEGSSEMKIFYMLKEWIPAAGINRHITMHCFRHTFATLALSKGVNIQVVSKLLGHQDIKTTTIYTHIINEEKRDAVDKMDF